LFGKIRCLLGAKKSFAAIDMDAATVRIAAIKFCSGRIVLEGLYSFPVYPGVFSNWLNGDGEDLTAVLTEAAKECGLKGKPVVTSLPGDRVITRHIQMPAMPAWEMQKALEWEAKKFIPVSLHDMVIRHVQLGEIIVSGARKVNLLLMACSLRLLHRYYEMFKKANICITALDLQPFALWRVLGEECWNPFPGKTIAAVDIGVSYCHLVVIKRGKVRYTRGFPLKGLAVELRRSLEFYKKHDSGTDVEALIFSGGVNRISNMKDYLEGQINASIKIFEFFEPAYVVAVGLALRGAVK